MKKRRVAFLLRESLYVLFFFLGILFGTNTAGTTSARTHTENDEYFEEVEVGVPERRVESKTSRIVGILGEDLLQRLRFAAERGDDAVELRASDGGGLGALQLICEVGGSVKVQRAVAAAAVGEQSRPQGARRRCKSRGVELFTTQV